MVKVNGRRSGGPEDWDVLDFLSLTLWVIQERLPSSMDLLQTYFWLGARWGPALNMHG